MSSEDPIPQTRLSDAIAQPLISAYRVGGMGLALLVLGSLLLTLSDTWFAGVSRYVALGLGLAVIALPCWFFYVREIRPVARTQQVIDRNRETIDAVQDVALAMTDLTMQIQSLAFKHAYVGRLVALREQTKQLLRAPR